MLAAFTCSLVAPKLNTARRINSLTLMPRFSAVAAIARFCAVVTNTTMRSLGLFMIGSHTCWHGRDGLVVRLIVRLLVRPAARGSDARAEPII